MTDDAQPIVTEDELDLDLIAPADRNLSLTISYRAIGDDGETGRVVGREKHRFPVRGTISVPQMTAFLRLETRINRALASDDPNADDELERSLSASMQTIEDCVSEKNPDAFGIREVDGVRARAILELDVQQVLVVLSWLAGDVSVADAVAKALTAGRTSARNEETDEREDEDGETGASGEGRAPLPLSEPSPSISSG